MKNKEFLNICYKYFNRYIIADELLTELSNIDKSNLTKEEIEEIDKIRNKIKDIMIQIPNTVDEYVTKKKESIQQWITKLETISKKNNVDIFDKKIEGLKRDYEKEMDSFDRWKSITNYIMKNEYFNKLYASLSDYELLEFIAQNIKAPFPPHLTQEEFDKLVKVGTEKEEKEWLWRLAFNYEHRNISFDSIVDYYIRIKDGYYLAELISAVGKDLEIDKIIDKINDKELIADLKKRKQVLKANVSEEQFNKMIDKLKER